MSMHSGAKSAESPNPDPWESAYLAFETPEQEVAKFLKRLQKLGATDWPKDAQIIELFCGRGSGLMALHELGFTRIEGVDLSPRLLAEYRGAGRIECCDCRNLSFPDASRDIAIVQGGLHHLPILPDDLERTLAEVERVLRPGGRLVLVEPWLTPFLRVAHWLVRQPWARRCHRKFDALQTMIEHEIRTYMQWLDQPALILNCLTSRFRTEICRKTYGKLMYVGRRP
jgi:ubiquinone/menaquinone biosynthesis C-methylase UbiE